MADEYAIISLPRSMSMSVTTMLKNNNINAYHGHYLFDKVTVDDLKKDIESLIFKIFTKKYISFEWMASYYYACLLEKTDNNDHKTYYVCLSEDDVNSINKVSKKINFPVDIEYGFVQIITKQLLSWIDWVFENRHYGILYTHEYQENPKKYIFEKWNLSIENDIIPGFRHPRPSEYCKMFSNYSHLNKVWMSYIKKLISDNAKKNILICDNQLILNF